MTLTITISPDAEKRLAARAAETGLTPEAYASKLIESGLNGVTNSPAAVPGGAFWSTATLDQLAATQGVASPCSFDDLLGGWPEEDESDGFEEAVAKWRKEDVRSGGS